MQGHTREYKSHSAYTLFEVLLSLALSTVVLLLVMGAIDIHLRHMLVDRMEVEESQLARAVLEKIAQDIRSVVIAVKEEELQVDAETLTLFFGSYGSEEAALLAAEEAGFDVGGETGSPGATGIDGEEEQDIYGAMPGIYGGLDWIQIDSTKLPRGEMFGSKQVRAGSTEMVDRLSPAKTLRYYLGDDTGQVATDDPRYEPDRLTGALGRSLDRDALRYGLFRRQLDRQVTQYAMNEGLETEYENYDEPLAPEVEWIEFRYFDPSAKTQNEAGEWLEYWDMDEMQTLPSAIEITLAIRKQFVKPSYFSSSTAEAPEHIVYSLVVPIPVTLDPVAEEEDTAGTEDGA